MKWTSLFALLLSFVLSLPPQAQAEFYLPTWEDLTESLSQEEQLLAPQAIQGLKVFILLNALESHIRIENYLYCLDDKAPLRNFSHTKSTEKMFNYSTSCSQAIQQLYSQIYPQFRQMRISMALNFKYIPLHSTEVEFKKALNNYPKHLYSNLPLLAPLNEDEIGAALNIVTSELNKATELWQQQHPNQFLSAQAKKSIFSEAFANIIKNNSDKYQKTIEDLPIIAFLPNYLLPKPTELDFGVLRNSFQKLFSINCNYLFKNFLAPQLNTHKEDLIKLTQETSFAEAKNKIAQEICQYNFKDSPVFADYVEAPFLTDFIVMLNHAYRQETFGLESTVFSPNNDNEFIEGLLNSNKVKLYKEVQYAPFHQQLDLNNIKPLLFYLSQTKAIEHLKSIPAWQQRAEVLEKIAVKANGSQMWSDLKTAGSLIGGGFLCQFALKPPKMLGAIGKLLTKAGNKVFKAPWAKKLRKSSEVCHLPLGLAGSTYFYQLENQRYDSAFYHFFASPFSDQLLNSFDQVEGGRIAVTLETVFFVVDIYGARGLLKSFSSQFSKIKKLLPKNTIPGVPHGN